MLSLLTPRLKLLALSLPHLEALAQSRSQLEKMLGLSPSAFQLNAPPDFLEEFQQALTNFNLPQLRTKPEVYPWNAHWLLILQAENKGIGGMGLSGPPDENGELSLGYFVDKKYEGQGLCSEAVQGLLAWIAQDPRVRRLRADTLPDGIGSQKVLQKNGFRLLDVKAEFMTWVYDMGEQP